MKLFSNTFNIHMKWSQVKLRETFNEMQENGWDTTNFLSWGFTFYAEDKEKLFNLFEEVKDYGFEIAKLDHQHNTDAWLMHLTKDETLLFEELHRRNVEFAELANYFRVSYEGWDVEKLD